MTPTTEKKQSLPKGFLVNGERGNVRPIHYELFPEDLFYSLLVYFAEGGYFVVSRVPGNKSGPPAHTHEVDQIFVCIRGELNLTVGEDEFLMTPGSLVVIPAGVPHAHNNSRDSEEVHLELILPGVIPSYPIVEFVEPNTPWRGNGHPLQLNPSSINDGTAMRALPGMLGSWEAGIVRLAPGESGSVGGTSSGEAYLYVLAGELEVLIGQQPAVTAGTDFFIRIPESQDATLRAASAEEADVFVIWPTD